MANETQPKQSDVENSQEHAVPAYGIQSEQFRLLAQELGVTQNVLQIFFNLVTEKQIPPEKLVESLQTIANSYADNLKELAGFDALDPDINALWDQARQALEQGDFNQAEEFLKQVTQAELAVAESQPQTASQHNRAAAEASAQNAKLHLTQLNDVKAASYFHKAAKILPRDNEEKLTDYFSELGCALYRVGRYTEAEPFLQQSLNSREKKLGATHPAVLASLQNLALLYHAQDKHEQAGLLEQKIFAIKSKPVEPAGADEFDPAENLSPEQTDCTAQETELQEPVKGESLIVAASENQQASQAHQQQESPDFEPQSVEVLSPETDSPVVLASQDQQQTAESVLSEPLMEQVKTSAQAPAAAAQEDDYDLFARIIEDFENAYPDEPFKNDELAGNRSFTSALIAPWVFGALLLLFYMEVLTVLPGELPASRHQMLAIFSSLLCTLFAFTFTGLFDFIARLNKALKLLVQSAVGISALALNFYWWQNPDIAPLKIQAELAPVQTAAEAKQIETVKEKEAVASPKISAEDTFITKAVLMRFLKQLREQAIPSEQYDSSLRQIAQRYHKNLKDLNTFKASSDDVKTVLVQARQALEDGEFDDAEKLVNKAQALELLAKDPNPEKTNKLKSQEIEQAEAELAQQEKTLGKEHVDIALSLSNLAALYEAKGAVEQAQALYERSLAIREKALGKDHPDVAISLNNLALLYKNQGKYEQAEPLYERSLAVNEKALGKNHPNVAASLDNLANLLDVQDKFEQAEPLHQRSMKIYEKVYGPEHPEVATSLNNLALLYYAQGKYAEAEPLYKKSLAIREKALGPEHPDVANSLNNLAFLYQAQAEYEKAEPLYKRAIGIVEKALGKDNAKTRLYQENYESLLVAKKVSGE